MGKCTEHAADRKKTKFSIGMNMRRFVRHSCTVLKNQRIFNKDKDMPGMPLLTTIGRSVVKACYYVFLANEIRVGENPMLAEKRLGLQEMALAEMTTFLMMLVPAKEVFGGTGNKFWHWADMAVKLKAEIKTWNDSEKKKFRPLLTALKSEREKTKDLEEPEEASLPQPFEPSKDLLF